MRAEFGALEASAERAGTALACLYSSSEEFEAAQVAARRGALWWRPQTIDGLLLVLTATGVAAFIALAVLVGLALITS